MKKFFKKLSALSLGISFILCTAHPLMAQDDIGDTFMLEEIKVTAQKREENQQKVPITMDVVAGGDMKELGQTDINDVLSDLGMAVVNKQADGWRVSLRGITDDSNVWSNLSTATPTVAISTDGVYSARNDRGMELYDVERVEVLVGPQSTLYASSSPGGIINVITASPKLETLEGSGLIEVGNYNYVHSEAMLNVPISDNFALRTAFNTSVRDGYNSNGTDDEDSKNLRIKALYQANENLSLTLTGNYKTSGGIGGMGYVDAFIDESDTSDPWTSSDDPDSPRTTHQKSIDATIDWTTPIGSLTLIPSFAKSESNWSETGQTVPDIDGEQTEYQETDNEESGFEGRMVSSEDFPLPFSWIAGFNWYQSENYRYTTYSPSTTVNENAFNNETTGVYANITYPLTDTIRVSGGTRYTEHEIKSVQTSYNLVSATGPGTVWEQNADGTWNSFNDSYCNYDGFDYKAGLEYDMGENTMVYLDYATSYRVTGAGDQGENFEYPPPEEIYSYTIGAKNRFFDNRLQVNLSLYWYDYKNKKPMGNPVAWVTAYEDEVFHDADGDGVLTGDELLGIDINGDGEILHDEERTVGDKWRSWWGDFTSRGVDLQTTWLITSNDKLDLSVSYLDNEWTDLVLKFYYNLIYPTIDYTGKTNTMAPEWGITAGYEHTFLLSEGSSLRTRIDTRYQSSYILTYRDADAPYNQQEGYTATNFTAVYSEPQGKWSLTGYVKNIENYAAKLSYDVGASDVGTIGDLRISAPRTYGLILSVKY